MSFTSAQLAAAVNGALDGDSTVVCCGATIDSRQCVQGNVFFALQGEHVDGHDFVQEAMDSGCGTVVVERRCDISIPQVVVQDSRKALFALALARRGEIAFNKVFAVTGSVGKTTTKDILAHVLGDSAVASQNSFNNDLGVPLTILEAEDAEFLVAEIGANDVGEIEPLANLVRPDIAILTSIGKAHLEGFGNQETVLQEKSKLLQALPHDGVAIVPDTIDFAHIKIAAQMCRVGTSDSADVQIRVGVDAMGYGELEMEGHMVTLSLLGEHNAINTAMAVVAASKATQGGSYRNLLEAACNVEPSAGRMRRMELGGVTILDDSYNANPASMRSALELFAKISGERKVLVLGDMLELGDASHAEHRLLASAIPQANADVIVLIGKEMEAASQIAGMVHEPTPDDAAISRIVAMIQDGDTVLIKGSRGLRLERIIESVLLAKVSRR